MLNICFTFQSCVGGPSLFCCAMTEPIAIATHVTEDKIIPINLQLIRYHSQLKVTWIIQLRYIHIWKSVFGYNQAFAASDQSLDNTISFKPAKHPGQSLTTDKVT